MGGRIRVTWEKPGLDVCVHVCVKINRPRLI